MLTENKQKYFCHSRGKLKRDMEILVGDFVEFEVLEENKGIIEKVNTRKNSLIRPNVSNIDNLIIVVAPTPKPDWMLIDKLMVSCYIEHIQPVLCFHKSDLLKDNEINDFLKEYKDVIKIVKTSIIDKNRGLKELYEIMDGHLNCFAGQSAVGKSSIINQILGDEVMEVCDLSPKIQRGKNTTRHIEIFDYGEGRVVDTCGFSMLEIEKLLPWELTYYYEEYISLMADCKYKNCTHIKEPGCEVKKAVEKGQLSKERYLRYINIFKELKEKEDEKY